MEQKKLSAYENRKQRIAYLEKLLAVTQKEKQQLQSDEAEAIINVTAKEWNAIVSGIDALETAFANMTIEDEQRLEFDELEKKAIEIMHAIKAAQSECEGVAQAKMDEYKAAIKDNKENQRRVSAYAMLGGNEPNSMFIDKKN